MKRLPPWIRTRLPAAYAMARVTAHTYARGLATVCREARCPNQGECADRGTATFLILGDRCTRNCSFCAVRHGPGEPLREDEPREVANAVASLGLTHAVITSVTRDDLPDGGAAVFAAVIREIRNISPQTTVEVLVPDFKGSMDALEMVVDAGPDVINHNLETVPRLYSVLRPSASYSRSLELLRRVASFGRNIITKSGIMVGVGEHRSEVLELVRDLVLADVSVLTIGQYLQPTQRHYPVQRFLFPHEFDQLAEAALARGMKWVESGPLVRSSYRAGAILRHLTMPEVPPEISGSA